MKRESTTRLSSQISEVPGATNRRQLGLALTLCCAMAFAWGGCTSMETPITGPVQTSKTSAEYVQEGYDTLGRKYVQTPAPAPKPASAPAPAPAPTPAPSPNSGSASAYFPSGRPEGSGLLLEKTAPAEVIAGQPFQYSYKVSNLTDLGLENVQVCDRVSSNFTTSDSQPNASGVSAGVATWNIGTLGPKQSKMIIVNGSSRDEGTVTTCGWAFYNPVVCQDIRVTKANIALSKSEPADELVCDMIPVTLTVKNTGSSPLSGVKITDNLPSGMVTSNATSNLSFDAGSLAPGESKEFKYVAAVNKTGKFVNEAKVTSTQGATATATATTTAHEPVLNIACVTPDRQYMGRSFEVAFIVTNSGDAAAAGSTLVITIPAGLAVSASGNGEVKENSITYDLGSIDVHGSRRVSATLLSANAGSLKFTGTVKGTCAAVATTSCTTVIAGIPAILLEKADDPDPVAVGDTTTYTVKVTNQGTADDSNVQVVVTIAPELVPVSTSEGTIAGQTVTLPVVPKLAAKQVVSYKIIARGVKAGDGHTKFTLTSDMLKSPIIAEESTTVY